MPDLLVISNDRKSVYLIEAKFTSHTDLTKYAQRKDKIDSYIKYWNDSVIVIIVPAKEYIYAQKVSKINPKKSYYYNKFGSEVYDFNLERDFIPICEIFPEITREMIEDVKDTINRIKNRS